MILNSVWATVPHVSVDVISFIITTLLFSSYKENSRGSTSWNTLLKATHMWQSRDSKLRLYAKKPVINHSAMVATTLLTPSGNWKSLKAEAEPLHWFGNITQWPAQEDTQWLCWLVESLPFEVHIPGMNHQSFPPQHMSSSKSLGESEDFIE